jgi:hypothetical protein
MTSPDVGRVNARSPRSPRRFLTVCVAVLVLLARPDAQATVSAQPILYEINGSTWLDLNTNRIRDEGEPLLGEVEVWSSLEGGQLGSRSRNSTSGRYRMRQTATGTIDVLAMVQGIKNGDG